MSVASHLAVSPGKYDARIRSLIPLYDELIPEVARALQYAARPVRTIVDLGIGTGALARACLEAMPGARIWGIDADADMMTIARTRLGRLSRRVTMTTGSFLDETLPPCDAMVASYSLHHIRTTRAKLAFYRRCYRTLRPGGVLINGDCAPAATPRGFARTCSRWSGRSVRASSNSFRRSTEQLSSIFPPQEPRSIPRKRRSSTSSRRF